MVVECVVPRETEDRARVSYCVMGPSGGTEQWRVGESGATLRSETGNTGCRALAAQVPNLHVPRSRSLPSHAPTWLWTWRRCRYRTRTAAQHQGTHTLKCRGGCNKQSRTATQHTPAGAGLAPTRNFMLGLAARTSSSTRSVISLVTVVYSASLMPTEEMPRQYRQASTEAGEGEERGETLAV